MEMRELPRIQADQDLLEVMTYVRAADRIFRRWTVKMENAGGAFWNAYEETVNEADDALAELELCLVALIGGRVPEDLDDALAPLIP